MGNKAVSTETEEDMEYGELWLSETKPDGSKRIVAYVLGFWTQDGKRTDENALALFVDSGIGLEEALIYFLLQADNSRAEAVIGIWGDAVLVDEDQPYRFKVYFFAPTPETREEVKKKYKRKEWVEQMRSFEKVVEEEEKIITS